jgi:phage anti-repressor protein
LNISKRWQNLKTLLESNFVEDEYYEISKLKKVKGKGKNNTKVVMLTYTCSKLLCMISKCEKADVIRRFYVDLEKLIITYKDSIVKDLNNQLENDANNVDIIKKNKQKALIYVLKVDDNVIKNENDDFDAKIGRSEDLELRMKQYKVGRVSELPIVLVYLTDDALEIENCLKECMNQYKLKKNKELFHINMALVKDTIKYCVKRKATLLKLNKKLLNGKDDRKIVIIIDTEHPELAKEFLKPKTVKRNSKKKVKKVGSKKIKKQKVGV